MIRSMTGYGSADIERNGQRLTAEIRSVNHRFCEVSVRAPRVMALFEDQIRQLDVAEILAEACLHEPGAQGSPLASQEAPRAADVADGPA